MNNLHAPLENIKTKSVKDPEETKRKRQAALAKARAAKKSTKAKEATQQSSKEKSEYERVKEEILLIAGERAEIVFDDEEQTAEFRYMKYTPLVGNKIKKTPIINSLVLKGVSVKNVPALVERCINI